LFLELDLNVEFFFLFSEQLVLQIKHLFLEIVVLVLIANDSILIDNLGSYDVGSQRLDFFDFLPN
jgi:hypothetical protein